MIAPVAITGARCLCRRGIAANFDLCIGGMGEKQEDRQKAGHDHHRHGRQQLAGLLPYASCVANLPPPHFKIPPCEAACQDNVEAPLGR